MTRTRISLAAALAAAALAGAPMAQAADAASAPSMTAPSAMTPAKGNHLAHADVSFMKDAAEAGAAEIETAQLAQSKSSDAKVKAFAKQMIADHGEAGDALKSLAATKNLTLPTGPSMVQKAKGKMLSARDGNSFDRDYAKLAVDDHEAAVKLFRKASTEAKDADVRAFAQKTLPTLEHHLQMARDLRSGAEQHAAR